MPNPALLQSIIDEWVADTTTAVVALRQLGQAVDEIFDTPSISALALEWGEEMEALELEVLLPMVDNMFDSGTLGWHIKDGRIRSRPLSGMEADGACVALAALTGRDLDDVLMSEDFFEGDSFTELRLSLTVEDATNIVFAGRDAP